MYFEHHHHHCHTWRYCFQCGVRYCETCGEEQWRRYSQIWDYQKQWDQVPYYYNGLGSPSQGMNGSAGGGTAGIGGAGGSASSGHTHS